jgi:hypothetical protein
VPEPSAVEVELAIEKLKIHKTDRILAELRQGVEQFAVRFITYYFYSE